jgi:glutaredoxin
MLNSKNKVIITSVLLVAALVGSLLFLSAKKNNTNQNTNQPNANVNTGSDVVLYYGDTCPHCLKVESFIDNNQFPIKNQIVKKEVFNNQANAEEMTQRAQQCGLDTGSLGVPFFWYKDRCVTGDEDIIKLLQSTTN